MLPLIFADLKPLMYADSMVVLRGNPREKSALSAGKEENAPADFRRSKSADVR